MIDVTASRVVLLQGDGAGGLAVAIGAAALCMLAVPIVIGGAVGYAIARRNDVDAEAPPTGASGSSRLAGVLLGTVLGGLLGGVVVTATFFESTFGPPRTLTFVPPAGYRHDEVILIEDASAQAIPWTGFDLPFTSQSARIAIDRGGVVRVRSLDALLSPCRAMLGGARDQGYTSFRAPPAATAVVIFDFAPFGEGREPDPPRHDDPTFAAWLQAREAED